MLLGTLSVEILSGLGWGCMLQRSCIYLCFLGQFKNSQLEAFHTVHVKGWKAMWQLSCVYKTLEREFPFLANAKVNMLPAAERVHFQFILFIHQGCSILGTPLFVVVSYWPSHTDQALGLAFVSRTLPSHLNGSSGAAYSLDLGFCFIFDFWYFADFLAISSVYSKYYS